MKRIISFLLAIALLSAACAYAEDQSIFETEWYQQALRDSEMSLGNNSRLKKFFDKAQKGEHITVSVIGGSITEGAGAKSYAECWASRVWVRLKKKFGIDNGANVSFINAGVGGTGSPFGYLRYQRDIVGRIPEKDSDGLPDIVFIEYSVNDWEEPTGHRCFESMVREILDAPNEPAVILLFAVFRNGWNLQSELRRIGAAYDLMMVSIRDGIYKHINKEIPCSDFFADEYHPTSLGHRMMADCIMQCITDALDRETDADSAATVRPVFGTDFVGLKSIFGDTEPSGYHVERGGFSHSDETAYRNRPVGLVCGLNFHHRPDDSVEPLKVSGTFRKCLIAWKAASEASYGTAEILLDGAVRRTLNGGPGKWGQSEVVLVLDDVDSAFHTLEIRMKDPKKKFTITAIGLE